MATGLGTVTLNFGDTSRPVINRTEKITSDSHPSPSTWRYIGDGPDRFNSAWRLYWLNNRIVALLYNWTGNTIFSSIDGGVNWIRHGTIGSAAWTGIAHDGTRYIMAARDTDQAYYSTDLNNWSVTTQYTLLGTTIKILVFDALNNVTVAIGGGQSYYLPVGSTTWVQGGTIPTGTSVVDAIYNPITQYVLVAQSAVSNTAVSTNGGVTWNAGQSFFSSRTCARLKIDPQENYIYASTNTIGHFQYSEGSALSSWAPMTYNPPITTTAPAIGVGGPNRDVIIANSGSFNHIPAVFKGSQGAIVPVYEPVFPIPIKVFDILYVPSTFNYYLAMSENGVFVYGSPAIKDPGNIRTITNATEVKEPALPAPGINTASYTVTGLTSFQATDNVEVWIMGSDSTSSHNQYEHQLLPIKLSISNPVTGVGFTINATSKYRLTGEIKVRYVFAS